MSEKKRGFTVSAVIHIVVVLTSAIVISLCGYHAYRFSNNIFNEKSVDTWDNAKQITVVVPEGVTPKQLAHIMYENGLTNDETIFYYQIMFSDFKDDIVAGSYSLETSMKPTEILKFISSENNDK